MKNKLVILVIMMLSLCSFGQTKEEVENHLAQNLKLLTYFKENYKTKFNYGIVESFVEFQNGAFIFNTNTHKVEEYIKGLSTTIVNSQYIIEPDAILWEEMSNLIIIEPEVWEGKPYLYVQIKLKKGSKIKVINTLIDENRQRSEESNIYIAGENTTIRTKNINGEPISYEILINDVEFNFLSAEKNDTANQNAEEALYWIFELSKLSGGEEYKN